MRLIDADKLLDALPKNDMLLSVDVRRVILDQPDGSVVPMDYHERCMELVENEKIKLAKALKLAQETNRRILENYAPVVRCKDCTCNSQAPGCLVNVPEDAGWCMLQGHVTLPDDFCSNGEGRENEHDKS